MNGLHLPQPWELRMEWEQADPGWFICSVPTGSVVLVLDDEIAISRAHAERVLRALAREFADESALMQVPNGFAEGHRLRVKDRLGHQSYNGHVGSVRHDPDIPPAFVALTMDDGWRIYVRPDEVEAP